MQIKTSNGEVDPCIPGQPLLSISREKDVYKFMAGDLLHDRLNDLYPIMWLIATQRNDHISALHAQIVKGRNIIITEDPGLHLLWYYDRVFIKPLPPYLTSRTIWSHFLCHEDSAEL